jgi:hypothetical protein
MLVFQIAGPIALLFFSMRLAGRCRTKRQGWDRAGSTAHQFTGHKADIP